MNALADTPEPPYYAVIFTSQRSEGQGDAYAQTAQEMEALAAAQPGYLGIEAVRVDDGLGITVSYWESLDAIARWRDHADHLTAQRLGREKFYRAYRLRVAKVERDRAWPR